MTANSCNNKLTELFQAPVMVGNEEDEAGGGGTRPDLERSLSSGPSPTFWQWLKSIFTASDDYIYQNCGDDALQYLRFTTKAEFECTGENRRFDQCILFWTNQSKSHVP